MERGGVWGSFALGCLGWLCCLLLARSGASGHSGASEGSGAARENEGAPSAAKSAANRVAPGFWWLAVGLTLGVWATSLPTSAPFSAGQGWGRGWLLGGGGALAAAFVVSQGLSRSNNRPANMAMRAMATASLCAALPVVCVPLLWMRHAVIDALLGIALGWVAVSLVLILGLKRVETSPREQETAPSQSDSLQSAPSQTPHMSTHAAPAVPNRSVTAHENAGRAGNADVATSDVAASDVAALLVLNGSAFVAALCGACALGVYRDFVVATVARGTYSAVAVALAASVALALLAGALIGEIAPRATRSIDVLGLLPVVALPLGLAFLLATHILDDIELIYVTGAGLLLGLLLWWLAFDAALAEIGSEKAAGQAAIHAQTLVPPVAILVALCGFMLAFQWMQGFGVGLMLLAAWPVSILALPSLRQGQAPAFASPNAGIAANAETQSHVGTVTKATATLDNAPVLIAQRTAQALCRVWSFLVILLLSRLFAMRFRVELRGANFSDQYAIFGFAAGAVLPSLLVSLLASPDSRRMFAPRSSERASVPSGSSAFDDASARAVWTQFSLLQMAFAGVLALALPAAMLALWGVKVVPAFFAGLALAVVAFAPPSAHLRNIVAAFGLAISLAVSQWAHRLAPLAEVSRAQRLHLLLCGMAALLVLFLVLRFMTWLRERGKSVAENV